jgi:hypothetical protein
MWYVASHDPDCVQQMIIGASMIAWQNPANGHNLSTE